MSDNHGDKDIYVPAAGPNVRTLAFLPEVCVVPSQINTLAADDDVTVANSDELADNMQQVPITIAITKSKRQKRRFRRRVMYRRGRRSHSKRTRLQSTQPMLIMHVPTVGIAKSVAYSAEQFALPITMREPSLATITTPNTSKYVDARPKTADASMSYSTAKLLQPDGERINVYGARPRSGGTLYPTHHQSSLSQLHKRSRPYIGFMSDEPERPSLDNLPSWYAKSSTDKLLASSKLSPILREEQRLRQRVLRNIKHTSSTLGAKFLHFGDRSAVEEKLYILLSTILNRRARELTRLALQRWIRRFNNELQHENKILDRTEMQTGGVNSLTRTIFRHSTRRALKRWRRAAVFETRSRRREAATRIQQWQRRGGNDNQSKLNAARLLTAAVESRQYLTQSALSAVFITLCSQVWQFDRADKSVLLAAQRGAAMTVQRTFRRYRSRCLIFFIREQKNILVARQAAARAIQRCVHSWFACTLVRDRRCEWLSAERSRMSTLVLDIQSVVDKRVAAAEMLQRIRRKFVNEERAKVHKIRTDAAKVIQQIYRVINNRYALHVKLRVRKQMKLEQRSLQEIVSAILIQKLFRAKCARLYYEQIMNNRHASARVIQLWWWRRTGASISMMIMQLRLLRGKLISANATTIQRVLRGAWCRTRVDAIRIELERRNSAAVCIECALRSCIARKRMHEHRVRRAKLQSRMATRIVQWWNAEWKRYLAEEMIRQQAATLIQAHVRRFNARKTYLTKRWICIRLQTYFRALMARAFCDKLRRERSSLQIQTSLIRPALAKINMKQQRIFRRKQVHKQSAALRKLLANRVKASERIQRALRCFIARCVRSRLYHAWRRRAAVVLQRHGRGVGVRQIMIRQRRYKASIVLQRWEICCINRSRLASRFASRRLRLDLEFGSAVIIQTIVRKRQARVLVEITRNHIELAKEEHVHAKERTYRRHEAEILTHLRNELDSNLIAHRYEILEELRLEMLRRLARDQRGEEQKWRVHLLHKGIRSYAEREMLRQRQVNNAWELADVGINDRALLRDRRTALAQRDQNELMRIDNQLELQEELKQTLVSRAPGQAAYLFNTLTMDAVWDGAPLVDVDISYTNKSGLNHRTLSPTAQQACDDNAVLSPQDKWKSLPCSRHERHDEASVAIWFATRQAPQDLRATHYCVQCKAVFCYSCDNVLHAHETGCFANHARAALEYLAQTEPEAAVIMVPDEADPDEQHSGDESIGRRSNSVNGVVVEQKETVAFRPSGPRMPSTASSTSLIDTHTPEHRQALAASVSPPSASNAMKNSMFHNNTTTATTAKQARTMTCGRCERRLVEVGCVECAEMMCEHCFQSRHAHGTRRAQHKSVKFPLRVTTHSIPLPQDEVDCDECSPGLYVTAVRRCAPCGQNYCVPCFDRFHRKGQRQGHRYTLVIESDMWKRMFDIDKGKYYFVNDHTNEMVWTKPPALMGTVERHEYLTRVAAEKRHEEAMAEARSELGQLRVRVEKLRKWHQDVEEENDFISSELAKADETSAVGVATSRARAIMQEGKSAGEAAQTAALREYMRALISEKDVGIRVDRIKKATYGASVLTALEDSREKHRDAGVEETAKTLTAPELEKSVLRLRKRFPKDDTVGLGRACAKYDIPYGSHVRRAADRIERIEALKRLAVVEHIEHVRAKRELKEKTELARGHVQIEKIRQRFEQMKASNAIKPPVTAP